MEFKSKLCSLHPSLQFTHEVESNIYLSFLDVLVERIVDGGFVKFNSVNYYSLNTVSEFINSV